VFTIAQATMSSRQRVVTGAALALFPLLVQIPFGILAARFDYPAVLRLPAEVLLPRFAAGGPALVAVWLAYALCVLPFMIAVVATPAALGRRDARLPLVLGVVTTAAQWIGLLRWTFVVPALAARYVDPTASEATRAAIAVAFEVQHRLFGALLGEHVGQATLALWTACVSAIVSPALGARVLRPLGFTAAGLFLAGLSQGIGEPLGVGVRALAHVPVVAFGVWSIWVIGLGARLAWVARREARSPSVRHSGSPESMVVSARPRHPGPPSPRWRSPPSGIVQ
jgi:hypothetical protein